MKNFRLKSRKGFTLIELLIVIAIIAVLAVALLPNIFGAPQAKSRDARRITDLEKIQNALVSAKNFDATAYPATGVCISGAANWNAKITAYLGNNLPADPTSTNALSLENDPTADLACTGTYGYSVPAGFSFGLYAKLETKDYGNIDCDVIKAGGTNAPTDDQFGDLPDSDADSCYAILIK